MPSQAPNPALLALMVDHSCGDLERAAVSAGVEVVYTRSVAELLERLTSRPWEATLMSLSIDNVDEALATRIAEHVNSGSLLLSAAGISIERALLVERTGAVALLREPLDEDDVRSRLAAIANEGVEVRLPDLPSAPTDVKEAAPIMVGESHTMGAVFETLARVARSDATVLVTGESGTGKEVIARTLHWASDRKKGPFVAVNCAAIPEHLLESELFGHERGAFTGAVARRMGRFERAHQGTLFLDEIGDMSLVLQAKILRVLEERTVERVGGEASHSVDIRVVAATNQDLETARAEGRFREDLFFRLAVVQLHLPPLRERGKDLRRLALHFAAHFAHRHGSSVESITERALLRLEAGSWPGNVRELRNVMDRAVLLARGPLIRSGDLRVGEASPRASASIGLGEARPYSATLSLEEVEAEHIQRVLTSAEGHIGRAATVLGIHRNTLTRKLRDYGIEARNAPRS